MDKKDLILYLTSIIAIVALALSIYSFAGLIRLRKDTKDFAEEVIPILEKLDPLATEFEGVSSLLPRLKNLLLGVPPVVPNE